MSARHSEIEQTAPAHPDQNPPLPVHSYATNGLFVLALLYTASIAATIVIPIVIGFLLSMILATPVRRLTGWYVPRPVASAIMLAIVIGLLGLLVVLPAQPAKTWIRDMPATATELAERIRSMTVPIQDVKEVAEEVEKMAQLDDESTDATQVVKLAPPSFAQVLLDSAPRLAASTLFAFFLAYLLLCSGDAMLRRIITLLCAIDDQRRSLLITRKIQAELFRYLAAITAINIGLGLATAGVLYALGVPNAFLWGVVAGLSNFAPLVGAAITIFVLTVVGMTTFESTGQALMVPFAFFLLTSIESQIVTPTIVGRRLALSPVVVLLSLVALGWMWGVAGLLLAVPIVASARIICANVPRLNRVAFLLGR